MTMSVAVLYFFPLFPCVCFFFSFCFRRPSSYLQIKLGVISKHWRWLSSIVNVSQFETRDHNPSQRAQASRCRRYPPPFFFLTSPSHPVR